MFKSLSVKVYYGKFKTLLNEHLDYTVLVHSAKLYAIEMMF